MTTTAQIWGVVVVPVIFGAALGCLLSNDSIDRKIERVTITALGANTAGVLWLAFVRAMQ